MKQFHVGIVCLENASRKEERVVGMSMRPDEGSKSLGFAMGWGPGRARGFIPGWQVACEATQRCILANSP